MSSFWVKRRPSTKCRWSTFDAEDHTSPECLFDVAELGRIEEGTDLEVFLKAVPTGRTNEHRGYLCNRVLKVLKTHSLIPIAAPSSFGALNASGQREFWKQIREQRKQDTSLVWAEICEAAINRTPPPVEPAAAESGSVVTDRL
ncbi:hypothetical protein B484DRAFT_431633 [Ochromonadaceae sp. CCMP2298]|nr:hypothetical protein B484DRAFT_431633 [Ochromonadaceae sp. CCMP2298]